MRFLHVTAPFRSLSRASALGAREKKSRVTFVRKVSVSRFCVFSKRHFSEICMSI